MKDQIKVITWTPTGELICFSTKIVSKEGKQGIYYRGDHYEIHPEKVLLSKSPLSRKLRPTIILNPFLGDMVHTLSDEQWHEKFIQVSKKVRGT